MILVQKSVTAIAVLLSSFTLLATANAQSTSQFRGVDRSQINDHGVSNRITAEPLNRPAMDFYVDIEDTFDRTGPLSGSSVDTHLHQLVAPSFGVPDGPLTGESLSQVGRWSGGSYTVNNGRLTGSGVASLPWAVPAGLGDDYLIEMSAVIGQGETARFGYLGESDSPNSTIDSDLAELGLSVTRLSGTELEWSVAWNMEDGTRQDFTSTFTTPENSSGKEIQLLLGWEDVMTSNNDLFDAWIGTSQGRSRLLAGNMASSIDVRSIGLEIDGAATYVTNFRAAVPEPNSLGLAFIAIAGLFGVCRLRN